MLGHLLRRVFYVFCLLGFGACSGGLAGSNSGGQLGSDDAVPVTDPSLLPISGTARYDGFLTLNLPTQSGRQPFTGSLFLDVDFDASAAQVTGEAQNFLSPNNANMQGRLMVTDGEIDRSANTADEYTFEAGISGTLRGPEFRNLVISGAMLGDFAGDKAEAISGLSFGDVVTSTGVDIYNGTFSAAVN